MERIGTGVLGLDAVLGGGIPVGSTVLVGGVPGAGKTILSTQLAFHHAARNRRVLMYSALSEANTKLLAQLEGLSYFQPEVVGDQLQILDLGRLLTDGGLDATLAEIRSAVIERRVEVVILDSLRGLHTLAQDDAAVQRFLFSLGSALYLVGCTTILVDDRYILGDHTSAEAALSDVVLSLEVGLLGRREHRSLRVVKARGTRPLSGSHSFEIGEDGVEVYPRTDSLFRDDDAPASERRLSWGTARLDELTDGGLPEYNTTLVLGTVGAGKTTLGLQFVAEGVRAGESCLYVTLHESPEELLRRAGAFGLELRDAAASGALEFLYVSPTDADLDKTLNAILAMLQRRRGGRLVIDTINYLEREAARDDRFTEVVAALVRALRARRVSTIIIREMTTLVGPVLDVANGSESYWTPVDNILLMRPVELDGRVSRVLSVLKMRGAAHDAGIYSYEIGERGVRVGEALEGLQGLLTGTPRPYRAATRDS